MEIAEAIETVEKYLSAEAVEMNNFGSALPGYVNPKIKLQILHDHTEEHDFGWVFFYNSTKYIETGDYREALLGNAPLIVNKVSKEIIVTGTAHDVSYYVSNYIKTGDPHNEEQ
jgi:hypothetical protein